jgi:maleate isomerase
VASPEFVDIIVDIHNVVFSVYTNVDSFAGIAHDAAWRGMRRPTCRTTMAHSMRLGVLTPSSNTALEPLTSALATAVPGCSAHFSRFRVTEISLSDAALGQFDDSKILGAAELLADANVDVIGWSGTAAGWRGFDTDRVLVQRIRERTGIPATTAVLALNELLAIRGVTRLALVTPYTADVQQRIVDNYRAIGIDVVAERHLGIRVNHDFALVQPERLRSLMGEVAEAKPQAITTFCTNLRAAPLAESVEAELGIPLLDTVSTTVWGQLRAVGADPTQVRGWGQLFAW